MVKKYLSNIMGRTDIEMLTVQILDITKARVFRGLLDEIYYCFLLKDTFAVNVLSIVVQFT
jgi:hypothetical protein